MGKFFFTIVIFSQIICQCMFKHFAVHVLTCRNFFLQYSAKSDYAEDGSAHMHALCSFRRSSVESDSVFSPTGFQHPSFADSNVFSEPTDCHAAQCPIHQRYGRTANLRLVTRHFVWDLNSTLNWRLVLMRGTNGRSGPLLSSVRLSVRDKQRKEAVLYDLYFQ